MKSLMQMFIQVLAYKEEGMTMINSQLIAAGRKR